MESEDKLNNLLQNLLKEVEQQDQQNKSKKIVEEFITIMLCVVLLGKTQHDPKLYEVAKRKVLSTLGELTIYKEYISDLQKNN